MYNKTRHPHVDGDPGIKSLDPRLREDDDEQRI